MARTFSVQTDKTSNGVLDFMRGYVHKHGYQPTIREIASGMGISSTSVVAYYLSNLERRGRIERGHGARAIRILDGVCPHCGQPVNATN